jgi:hypothetical protein
MLVTRYDGVWIIVLAFNEAPVIARPPGPALALKK